MVVEDVEKDDEAYIEMGHVIVRVEEPLLMDTEYEGNMSAPTATQSTTWLPVDSCIKLSEHPPAR